MSSARRGEPAPTGGVSAEDLARVFYTTYRIETVCLRLFNVYGPRERTDDDEELARDFVHHAEYR